VRRPFEKLGGGATAVSEKLPTPLVIVINALDECSNQREVEFLLRLMSNKLALAVSQLRIFLTSWPEIVIRRILSKVPASLCQHLILHRIDPFVIDGDICLFFKQNVQSHQGGTCVAR
jgi:hypothetical protein